MIELVTGLPGAGKTLFTIARIKEKSERENRPVYYHGINDLQLPWIPLEDPKKWFECEPNAIILIDECQQFFRPTPPSQGVPDCISRMETHRHGGVDLVLMTQQPRLLHSNVRELVGHHLHIVRMFGLTRSRIHEWDQCVDDPRKQRKGSRYSDCWFPKAAYKFYKSAEVHTHQAKVPMRVWFLFACPFIAGGLCWAAWHFGFSRISPKTENFQGLPGGASVQNQPGQMQFAGAPGQGRGGQQSSARRMTKAEYFEQMEPRIPGLDHTAPVYDDVTKPVRAPYPAACVSTKTRCRCYTTQGTRLGVPDEICRGISQGGYYVAWQQDQPQVQGQVVAAPAVTTQTTTGVFMPKS